MAKGTGSPDCVGIFAHSAWPFVIKDFPMTAPLQSGRVDRELRLFVYLCTLWWMPSVALISPCLLTHIHMVSWFLYLFLFFFLTYNLLKSQANGYHSLWWLSTEGHYFHQIQIFLEVIFTLSPNLLSSTKKNLLVGESVCRTKGYISFQLCDLNYDSLQRGSNLKRLPHLLTQCYILFKVMKTFYLFNSKG